MSDAMIAREQLKSTVLVWAVLCFIVMSAGNAKADTRKYRGHKETVHFITDEKISTRFHKSFIKHARNPQRCKGHHNPLCKRILRRNKTGGPIPPLWLIGVVIGLMVLFALLLFLAIGCLVKFGNTPNNKD